MKSVVVTQKVVVLTKTFFAGAAIVTDEESAALVEADALTGDPEEYVPETPGGGEVDPADLISADDDNALVQGADDKLFVPEGGGGGGISGELTGGKVPVADAEGNLVDSFVEAQEDSFIVNGSMVASLPGSSTAGHQFSVGSTFFSINGPETSDDVVVESSTAAVRFNVPTVTWNGNVVLTTEDLPPTTDPGVEGEIWIDGGVWKVSTGA